MQVPNVEKRSVVTLALGEAIHQQRAIDRHRQMMAITVQKRWSPARQEHSRTSQLRETTPSA